MKQLIKIREYLIYVLFLIICVNGIGTAMGFATTESHAIMSSSDQMTLTSFIDDGRLVIESGRINFGSNKGANLTGDGTMLRCRNAIHLDQELMLPKGYVFDRVFYYTSWSNIGSFSFAKSITVNKQSFLFDGNYAYARFTIKNSEGGNIPLKLFLSALQLSNKSTDTIISKPDTINWVGDGHTLGTKDGCVASMPYRNCTEMIRLADVSGLTINSQSMPSFYVYYYDDNYSFIVSNGWKKTKEYSFDDAPTKAVFVRLMADTRTCSTKDFVLTTKATGMKSGAVRTANKTPHISVENKLRYDNNKPKKIRKEIPNTINGVNWSSKGYVLLSKQSSLAKQMTKKNTVYEVKYDFDLKSSSITIPSGCVLKFTGGKLMNGMIVGTGTTILADTQPIFTNVRIGGTWKNTKAYLSWFNFGNDATTDIENLCRISNIVLLDADASISGQANISNQEIEIDGCGHTFTICIQDDSNTKGEYASININGALRASVHDCRFVYSENLETSETTTVYKCVKIKPSSTSSASVEVYNISISGFDNRNTNLASFYGLHIASFNENCTCSLHDITIYNCIVLGDGYIASGSGANYPLVVQSNQNAKATGGGEIFNINVTMVANANPTDLSDLAYIEDTSGIYIMALGKEVRVSIHDCSFENCGRRCLKIQGDKAYVKNIKNKLTTKVVDGKEKYVVKQSVAINFQGDNGVVEHFVGDISGAIGSFYTSATFLNCSFLVMEQASYDQLFYLFEGSTLNLTNCKFNVNATPTYAMVVIAPKTNVPKTTITFENCKVSVHENVRLPFVHTRSSQSKIVNLNFSNSEIDLTDNLLTQSSQIKVSLNKVNTKVHFANERLREQLP